MTKQAVMREARNRRDSERKALGLKDLSLDDFRAERKRINDEYVVILEANKPTHHRLSAWQRADNAGFQRWYKLQHHQG